MFEKLKKEERETRRKLIVETAESIFQEKGFNEVTLRNVADQVGISPGTIYTYFKNKEELLLCILNGNIDLLGTGMKSSLAESAPVACLRSMAHEYRKYYMRFGRFVDVVDFLARQKDGFADVSPDLLNEIRDKVAGLMKMVETRLSAEDMRPLLKGVHPARATAVLWALGQGLTRLTLPAAIIKSDLDWFQFDRLLDDIIQLAIDPEND